MANQHNAAPIPRVEQPGSSSAHNLKVTGSNPSRNPTSNRSLQAVRLPVDIKCLRELIFF